MGVVGLRSSITPLYAQPAAPHHHHYAPASRTHAWRARAYAPHRAALPRLPRAWRLPPRHCAAHSCPPHYRRACHLPCPIPPGATPHAAPPALPATAAHRRCCITPPCKHLIPHRPDRHFRHGLGRQAYTACNTTHLRAPRNAHLHSRRLRLLRTFTAPSRSTYGS